LFFTCKSPAGTIFVKAVINS